MPTSAIACSRAMSCIATSPRTSRRWATGSMRLAVALGGYNELAIRLMPIPFVLVDARLALVDRRQARGPAGRLPGPAALRLAQHRSVPLRQRIEHGTFHELVLGRLAGVHDPGMERGVAAGRWSLLAPSWEQLRWSSRWRFLPAVVYLAAIALAARSRDGRGTSKLACALGDLLGFGLGLALMVGLPPLVLLIAQGAGSAAFEDIIQYGRALATDTLPEPGAPFGLGFAG